MFPVLLVNRVGIDNDTLLKMRKGGEGREREEAKEREGGRERGGERGEEEKGERRGGRQ